ncbi:ABATE domain-containing protein [Actinacidiphila epipremni]|uniref:CGNR zinc finger domain-containing protein n=1 Tax=Actinacidiphila epipremni TaxID=2053013 RepID=A0ABX0ZKR5_9ACTN|nr:CGNR zinc finger domain-containing protein [Actinacidiphila epipremni]NJP43896.1 CGNR zinc finger domain-containing protein [Actinacidiphila epipremni]
MAADHLAVDLAVTVRHDGHDGIADDLAAPEGLTGWVRAHAGVLAADLEPAGGAAGFTADAAALAAAVEVRTAVRALFARAVLPGPPSAADAGRLPSAAQAADRLNAAAARVPYAPRLDWPHDAAPTAGRTVAGAPSAADLVAAALARHAIAFLTGPDRERLRACPAPRCVRYFVKEHARQEWCKPSCGNRARVARHHARHRATAAQRAAAAAPDAGGATGGDGGGGGGASGAHGGTDLAREA